MEACVALGAESKPKSWSKYAADSSAYKKIHGIPNDNVDSNKVDVAEKKPKTKKKSKAVELLNEHKDDPQFVEFMKTHDKGNGIWQNDWNVSELEETEKSNEKAEQETTNEPEEPVEQVKLADLEISDADYMKSLMKSKSEENITKPVKTKSTSKFVDLLTIKIRNIPLKTKRQDVLNFFKPIKLASVRLPVQVRGICYVGFKNEEDFKKAQLKNRSFWSKYTIFISSLSYI